MQKGIAEKDMKLKWVAKASAFDRLKNFNHDDFTANRVILDA